MKKNLFLLFSVYFFVVQGLIAWVIRGENNFFLLSAINLICIVLIASFQKVFEKWEKTESPAHESKKNEFVDHKHIHTNDKKQALSNKTRNFILSITIAIIIYLQWFKNSEAYSILLISVAAWFFIFLVLNAIFKSNDAKSKRQWWMGIVYVFLLAISLWLWIYGYIVQNDEVTQEIDNNDKIVTSGTVLESWMNAIDDLINSWNNSTGTVIATGTTEVNTWTAVTPTPTPTPTVKPTAGTSLKIIDAINYLFDKYNTTLSTKKDISFTYVSKTSPIYPIYRTAYEKKMIWKSTNPTKMILCDSYIVMKWLMGKWDVVYNATNATTQFRNEAVARWALNGCQKGKTVKQANL